MQNPFFAIDDRFGLDPLPSANRPIFLLAAGWRSGSTLLQRLVVSSRDVLVWGEPYGRAGVIPAITGVAQTFQPQWPADAALAPERNLLDVDLSQHWIANLYPEPAALRAGLRTLIDTWLREPAEARGFRRFGLKEVRLSVVDAMVLQWLYPDARFVCLVRNPWDAWSSMKGGQWILKWPDQVVTQVEHFVKVWNGLYKSFLMWDDPAVLRVRYEDLRDPTTSLAGLADHLGLPHIEEDVRQTTLRGINKPPIPLSPEEISAIDAVCGPLARAQGYAPPPLEVGAL